MVNGREIDVGGAARVRQCDHPHLPDGKTGLRKISQIDKIELAKPIAIVWRLHYNWRCGQCTFSAINSHTRSETI